MRTIKTTVFALEGPDGVGKSTQVGRVFNLVCGHLAANNTAHNYDIVSFSHEAHNHKVAPQAFVVPEQQRRVNNALLWWRDRNNLLARVQMLKFPSQDTRHIIISDRWDMSTHILGCALPDPTLLDIADCERRSRICQTNVKYIVLHENKDALIERLESRGETNTELDDAIRRSYYGSLCEAFAGSRNVARINCQPDKSSTSELVAAYILTCIEETYEAQK